MKWYRLLVFLSIILFVSCSTAEQTRTIPKPSTVTDCSPEGKGLLDSLINYDFIFWMDSTNEYAPYITIDPVTKGEILWFTSSRYDTLSREYKLPAEIYFAKKSGGKCPEEGWNLPERFNTNYPFFDKWVKGTMTVHGNSLIVSSMRQVADDNTYGGSYNLDLWEMQISGTNVVSQPKALDNTINSPYWESHPALSPDGNMLFFVSDRPLNGGQRGNKNIWYSQKVDGKWMPAQPLFTVNTDFDEVSPFMSSDGKFYFSSNKNGNFDIYICNDFMISSGVKLPCKPININDVNYSGCSANKKIKINTEYDEQFPFVNSNCTAIYYSSNRPGGFKLYDIYACALPQPCYRLKVDIYDIVEKLDKKAENDKQLNPNRLYYISGGQYFNKAFKSDNTVELAPDTKYTISIKDEVAQCKYCTIVGSKSYSFETNSQSSCGTDSLYKYEFSVLCQSKSDTSILKSANFCTGYWYPLTKDNLTEFQKRCSGNFFGNSAYVNCSCNDAKADPSINEIVGFLRNAVEFYKDCINDKDFKIRVSIKAFTDIRGLRTPDTYPDKSVNVGGTQINTGDAMSHGGQAGNVYLSKLRAYYTYETIDKIMSSNSAYKALKDKNLIIYDFNGFGIDYETALNKCKLSPDCEDARRVDVFVDAGPVWWLEKNKRLPLPDKIDYKPIPSKESKAKLLATLKEKMIPEPWRKIKKKECEEFNVDYTFNSLSDAEFVKNVIEYFTDEEYFIKEVELSENRTVYRLESENVYPDDHCAYGEANAMRKITSQAASILKGAWPHVNSGNCQQYSITFGAFKNADSAKSYADSISAKGVECSRIDTMTVKDSVTLFVVRSGLFNSYEVAEKQSKRYINLLNKYKIMHYIRTVKVVEFDEGPFEDEFEHEFNEADEPEPDDFDEP